MGIIDFFFLFLLLTRIRVITEKFSSREIFKQLYYVKFQERIFDFPLFAQLMKNSRSVKFEKFEKFDRHIPFITFTFDYPRLIVGLYANSYAARIIGENIRFLSAMNHFNSCRDVICVRFSRLARHCPPFHRGSRNQTIHRHGQSSHCSVIIRLFFRGQGYTASLSSGQIN